MQPQDHPDQTATNHSEKRDWLRRLEQESWQSELVISGVAIYGSLQLNDSVSGLVGWSIDFFSTSSHQFLYLFFIYLFVGTTALTWCFVLHFILRALWVGLVGLNSVFPQGINLDTTSYPRDFMERIKQEFPSNNEDNIHRLDDFCSTIFAVCALTVMIFLAINTDVVLLLGLHYLLSQLMSPGAVEWILTGILIFVTASSVAQMILKSKWIQKNSSLAKWYYPLYHLSSRMLLHVFYRPITRLSFTFATNLKWSSYLLGLFLFVLIIMFSGTLKLAQSQALMLASPSLFEGKFSREDRLVPDHYEDQRSAQHGRILSVLIPGMLIKDPFLKVFVPVMGHESMTIDSVCGQWKHNDALSEAANKQERRKFTLECYGQYHRFYLNDSLYTPKIRFFDHPNEHEPGILTYLPLAHLPAGEHVLRVEKVSPQANGVSRKMIVPFIKAQ